MKTAIIYIRVSTADQISGTSLATQERDCAHWCERNGYEVVRTFSDEGESAKTADRPGLIASLDFARKHRIDCWVCWKLDRAARDQSDGLGIRATLRAHKCLLASATEPITDDPLGNLVAGMLFGIAQFDNEVRSARAKRAMQSVALRGGWTNPLPAGYQWAERKDNLPVLKPDPRLGPIIAAAYRALADGHPATEATRMLLDAGMSAKLASKTLRAPVYGGIIRGKLTGGQEIPSAFKGIVPPDIWRRAQAALRGATTRSSTGRHPQFPLAALAVCAACGAHVRGYSATGRHGKKIAYYDCPKGHARMRADRAHEEVLAIIADKILPMADELRQRVARLVAQETQVQQTARAEAQARVSATEGRLSRIVDAYADGTIDAETFRKKSASYREEIAAASAVVERNNRSIAGLSTCMDEVVRRMSNPAELWKSIDFAGRKQLISCFGLRLEICPDKHCRTASNPAQSQQVMTEKGSTFTDGAPTRRDLETAADIIRVVLGMQAA